MTWTRFFTALANLLLVAFTVGAMLSPPDPFTQLIFTAPLVLLSIPTAYLLAFRSYDFLGVSTTGPLFLFAALVVSLSLSYLVVAFVLLRFSVSPYLVNLLSLTLGLSVTAWIAFYGGMERILGVFELFRHGD